MLEYMDGFSKINSGSTRDVYICCSKDVPNIFLNWANKNVIIKEAKSDRGIEANKLENAIWRNNKFNFLCPVLDIFDNGKYLIMPKVSTEHITSHHVSNVVSEYRKYCYLSIHSDIKKSNIGIYNERPVLVDYPFIEQDYAGFDALHL